MNAQTALTKANLGNFNILEVTNSVIHAIDKLDGKDVKDIILALIAYKTITFVCTNKGKLAITFGDKKIVLGGE